VYISIVCFIKLTSSNSYKSRIFVSLIAAPYFKNAFAPGASIRRNTVCSFFVAFFSATIDDRNLIFGHKLHIGMPSCGKRFWTRQIPTSCLPTELVSIHIDYICTFFVTFFSATIDGRDLIFGHKLHIGTPYRGKRFWTHQIPTTCLST
jgi:hypothetical protein